MAGNRQYRVVAMPLETCAGAPPQISRPSGPAPLTLDAFGGRRISSVQPSKPVPRAVAMASDVVLRDVRAEDLPILFAHQQDPEAVRMAAFPARDRDAFDAHWARILADATCIARAIVVAGEVAGYIGSYGDVSERAVGYWIGREFWGRGVATAALRAFLRDVPARPLYAHVAKSNGGSLRVLERCGFLVVGENGAPAATGGEPVGEFVLRLG